MVQVVAGILEQQQKILICQRRPGQSHALQWEFPGGKVEPGETPERALSRELEEELGITQARGPVIASYEYTYPGKAPIRLLFFRVESYTGEPQNLIFQQMRWEPASVLEQFDFVAGDRQFLQGLATGDY